MPHFVKQHSVHHDQVAYTYSWYCFHHLAAELVTRASDGDTIMSTVNLEYGKQCLEDTTETLSSEKTSREGESPKIERLSMRLGVSLNRKGLQELLTLGFFLNHA